MIYLLCFCLTSMMNMDVAFMLEQKRLLNLKEMVTKMLKVTHSLHSISAI